jgi:hypothetical protein
MKRAVLYLRVSTVDQTTANQERELRAIAGRMGCEIIKVSKDHGVSGAKGREKRPGFEDAARVGIEWMRGDTGLSGRRRDFRTGLEMAELVTLPPSTAPDRAQAAAAEGMVPELRGGAADGVRSDAAR